jgi:succinate-semialdehyde dehydrogenase/glutarate-semialdehyde dehydrogenase
MSTPEAPGAGGRVGLRENRLTFTPADPSTGVSLATYDEDSPETVDATLRGAHEASAHRRLRSPTPRARELARLVRSLRERRDELALMATREMGKPLADSRAEVDKCAWACDWFAEHRPTMLEPEAVETQALATKVIYVPLASCSR